MQKCDFNKIALHWPLLKLGPRPWTWTHNTDSEKLGPWKTLTLKNIAHEKRVKITGCKKKQKKQKKRTLISKNVYERLCKNVSGTASFIFRRYFRSSMFYKKCICRSPFSIKLQKLRLKCY